MNEKEEEDIEDRGFRDKEGYDFDDFNKEEGITEEIPYEGDDPTWKPSEKDIEEFDRYLMNAEKNLKSDSQNNTWLKKDDDDEDIIDYVWESNNDETMNTD